MNKLAGLLALSFTACWRGQAGQPHDRQPEDEVWLSPQQIQAGHILIAEAKQQSLTQAIDLTGRVAFDDLHVTHVFSPVTGRITRILAKPGDRIAKGAPLVAIQSPDAGTAFSDLVKAQADLAAAELDFHREQHLLAEDATSQRSYEAAQDSYRRASAETARAAQRASMLQAGPVGSVGQEYILRSFLAGEVIARSASPGMEVAGQYSGGNAAELFTIGDIDRVAVYADVPDRDLARFHTGDPVDVHVLAYPDRSFHGAIDLVSSTVDPTARTGRVRCTLDNPGGALKPEMFATVSLAQPGPARVIVPRDAVVAINETRYVYVATGQRPDGRLAFKRRPVTIGSEQTGMIPIVDGLTAGDRVVVQGAVSQSKPSDVVRPTPQQLAEGHITTVRAEARDVAGAIAIGGRVSFDDTRLGHVFSPVNGRITRVLAQPGQRVAKGAPLVAISSPDIGGYLADVAKADADRTQAEHEAQRQRELYQTGVGAKRDLEAAEDALRRAGAEYDRASQLAQLLHADDFDRVAQEYVLRSPIAGEVIARKASPGLEVQGQYANGGSASNMVELFTIGETSQLWVLGDVYEIDLPRIHVGDAVTLDGDGAQVHGRVDWIADALDPVQHTAKVRCAIDNPDHRIKPEMYERLHIALAPRPAVVVPRSAIMRVDGETIAFVQTGDDKPSGGVGFQRRTLIAELDDNSPTVAVLSGLHAGEVVAADHALMLLGMP